MERKARAFLVPYRREANWQTDLWGPGPYYQVGIQSRRQDAREQSGDGYYMSLEMLASLHADIGRILAKEALSA